MNEGDIRDYEGFSELKLVDELKLNPDQFPDEEFLKKEENIGRLQVSIVDADINNDGLIDVLYMPGARSFSIYETSSFSLVLFLFFFLFFIVFRLFIYFFIFIFNFIYLFSEFIFYFIIY